MGREDKQIQNSMEYDDVFKENVYCCITYITHKCPLMQQFFSSWADLSCHQQALLNYCAFYILEKEDMTIFSSVIRGVNYWNTIQDTEGACGYNKNPFEFRLGKDEENRIFQVVADANRMISTIRRKAALSKEIGKHNIIFHNKKLIIIPKHHEEGDTN